MTEEFDQDRVDDAILALLHLNTFGDDGVDRAWKTFDWEAMDRLHEKGYIGDPKRKAKSVVLTERGAQRSAVLFQKLFS